jgi:hypothetical protein
MTQTWNEPKWEYNGQEYNVRIFEDMQGGEPGIFVVEPLYQGRMAPMDALGAQVALEGQLGFEKGQSRLFELSPEGTCYEHKIMPTPEQDASFTMRDMPYGEYQEDVKAGKVEPELKRATIFQETAISSEAVQEITGHQIESYEQSQQRQWMELQAPEVQY